MSCLLLKLSIYIRNRYLLKADGVGKQLVELLPLSPSLSFSLSPLCVVFPFVLIVSDEGYLVFDFGCLCIEQGEGEGGGGGVVNL